MMSLQIAMAQVTDKNLWSTYKIGYTSGTYNSGVVSAVVTNGSKLYVGGIFDYVGPKTPYNVVIDTLTGNTDENFPYPDGQITKAIPDGEGGWFVSGNFSKFGNTKAYRLAHILKDNTVDTKWNPLYYKSSLSYSYISNMMLYDTLVFISGQFKLNDADTSIYNIAAVGMKSGKVLLSSRIFVNSSISTFTVYEGKIYAAGYFTKYQTATRNGLAAWDIKTGNLTNWYPNSGTQLTINSIEANKGLIYIAGSFLKINGVNRSCIAAFDSATGILNNWNPVITASYLNIYKIAIKDTIAYICGSFTKVGGKDRKSLAAISLKTGLPTDWNPIVNINYAQNLFIYGNKLYLIDSRYQTSPPSNSQDQGIYIVNLTSGAILPFNHFFAGGNISTVAISEDRMYLGGGISSFGGVLRKNIAALDLKTGKATAWNPGADDKVNALAISNGILYAGGKFDSVYNQPHKFIAAIDTLTGIPLSWNPPVLADSLVNAIYISDGIIYAGGGFYKAGTDSRHNFAAFDIATEELTALDIDFDRTVNTITGNGTTLFVGGDFLNVNGTTQKYIVAIDKATGQIINWNPQISNTLPGKVMSILASDTLIWVSGLFNSVGGLPHKNIACISYNSAKPKDWKTDADNSVNVLAASQGYIYAGGKFTNINGKKRDGLAAFNKENGKLNNWAPMESIAAGMYYSFEKNAILPHLDKTYVGGTSGVKDNYNNYSPSLVAYSQAYNQINGKVYIDKNSNGLLDSAEIPYNNVLVKIEGNNDIFYTLTDTSGYFERNVGVDDYTVTVAFPPNVTSTKPVSYILNFDSLGLSANNLDFGLQMNQVKDLKITFTSLRRPRPGFDTYYNITYKNTGADIVSGYIEYTHPVQSVFVKSEPDTTSYNNPLMRWDFTNLKPGESRYISIQLKVKVSTALGIELQHIASIYPVVDDNTPNNNSDTLKEITSGSVDPNDKAVIPSGKITSTQVKKGTYLTYTVRFQNTGTDTCFTAYITDTLDINLNVNTFEMLAASHPYSLLIDNRIIKWTFENILLPDSGRNMAKSNGFVKYTIQPLTNVTGGMIKNLASIVFDFNEPVKTNSVLTEVQDVTSIGSQTAGKNQQGTLLVYPNPMSDKATIEFNTEKDGAVNIRLCDITGREIYVLYNAAMQKGNHRLIFKTGDLKNGLYILQYKTEEGSRNYKLIK